MGAAGFEPLRDSPGKSTVSDSGGSNSGNTRSDSDPDLAAVVRAWGTLPEPIRRAVLALVGTVTSITITKTPADAAPRGVSVTVTPDADRGGSALPERTGPSGDG